MKKEIKMEDGDASEKKISEPPRPPADTDRNHSCAAGGATGGRTAAKHLRSSIPPALCLITSDFELYKIFRRSVQE